MKYVHYLYLLLKKIDNTKKELYLLYGYTLPTSTDLTYNESYKKKIDNKHTLYSLCHTSDKPLDLTSSINLDCILSKDNNLSEYTLNINITSHRSVIKTYKEDEKLQSTQFGIVPTYTKIYTTNEINRLNPNELLMTKLTDNLTSLTKFPFNTQYKNALGSYEMQTVPLWLEQRNSICEINTTKDDLNNETSFVLNITDDKIEEKTLKVHLIIYNRNKEICYDLIHFVSTKNTNTVLTSVNSDTYSSYEHWIFEDDTLIARLFGRIIDSIGVSINVVEQNLNIDTTNFKNSSIPKGLIKNTEIYTNVNNSVITNNKTVDNLPLIPIQKNIGGLFIKSNDSNNNSAFESLKDFFNDITSGSKCSLTILDPFLSSTASLEYLLFLKNSQINITLISCWDNKISPDGVANYKLSKSINDTIATLNGISNRNLPLGNCKWFNLPKDAFHDRYIIVEHGDYKQIFTLSNSLNNLLSSFENLLIYLIEDSATLVNIEAYIISLKNKCLADKQIYPAI